MFKILLIFSAPSHSMQHTSHLPSVENRLALALLGFGHLLFPLLGMHISWNLKWLTIAIQFQLKCHLLKEALPNLRGEQAPSLNFSFPPGSILTFPSILVPKNYLIYHLLTRLLGHSPL